MKELPKYANYKARSMSCSEYADKLLQMSDDINDYIGWVNTPQGHEYWEKVRDNLKSLATCKVDEYMQVTVNGKKYKLVEVK